MYPTFYGDIAGSLTINRNLVHEIQLNIGRTFMSRTTPLFTGVATALITAFRDGEIDWQAMEQLIESQIASGVSALVPCGSTGESSTLTHGEHMNLVDFTIRKTRGRIPVIAGTGSNSTREATELSLKARVSRADGVLLISPYGNKPTQEGLFRHYQTVAKAGGPPIIAYNIPGRTGISIDPITIARLAEGGWIVGVKDATGSLDWTQEVIRRCGNEFAVFSGDDSLTLPIMAVGGRGVISVISNVVPTEFGKMVEAITRGDYEQARTLNYRLLPLMRALFLETNPIPVKAALSMMRICQDELRLPLVSMTTSNRAKLREELEKVGVVKK